jgi:hypothetical protein
MFVHLLSSSKNTDAQGRITRSQRWAVDGADSFDAAELAPGLPRWGAPYSLAEPYLIVSGMRVNPEGGQINTTSYIVDVDYSYRTNGGQKQLPSNPLQMPTRWTASIAGTNEQYDLDAKGRPIVNSARQRFNAPFTRLFTKFQLTGRRWVQASNINALIATARKYSNGVVNSDPFVFGIPKGQALVLGGGPVGEFFASGNSIVEIAYTFDIDEKGHKLRVRDIGTKIRNPNFNKGSNFSNSTEEYITPAVDPNSPGPFFLDGFGRRWGDNTNPKGSTPPNAKLETTADGAFLLFDQLTELPLKALGL